MFQENLDIDFMGAAQKTWPRAYLRFKNLKSGTAQDTKQLVVQNKLQGSPPNRFKRHELDSNLSPQQYVCVKPAQVSHLLYPVRFTIYFLTPKPYRKHF